MPKAKSHTVADPLDLVRAKRELLIKEREASTRYVSCADTYTWRDPNAADRREFERATEGIIEGVKPILILEGYSSTKELDAYREIVEPAAFVDTMPQFMEFPIYLFGHDWWGTPIGQVVSFEIDDYGLWTVRHIYGTPKGEEIATLVKAKVLRADSIGYNIPKGGIEEDDDGIDHHVRINLLEISVVNVPANRQSLIANIIEPDEEDEDDDKAVDPAIISAAMLGQIREEYQPQLKSIILPGADTEPGQEPVTRRHKLPAKTLDREAVNKEIDQALSPLKGDLGKLSATVEELGTKLDGVGTLTEQAKDALIEKAKAGTAELQEKIDKIAPDFAKVTDELADQIAELKKRNVPQGDLRSSPFTIKQLTYMPQARVKAAHDHVLSSRVEEFKTLTDRLMLCDMLLEAESEHFKKSYHTQPREERIKSLNMFSEWNDLRKAMDTATSGEGLEWIPTEWSPRLEELIRIALRVAPVFRELQMTSNPYTMPVLAADTIAKLLTETTGLVAPGDTTNAEDATTAKVTWDAKTARGRIQVSHEFVEDSIVPVLPLMEEMVVRSIARAKDQATLNGDISGTHMDTDTAAGAATLFQKAFSGLRKYANTAAKKDYADYTAAHAGEEVLYAMRDVRSGMGKYGLYPADLAAFTSIKVLLSHLISLTSVQTVEKLGPKAVILTGQLAQVDGIPLVPSEFSRDDTDATGVNGATGNTFSLLTLANKNAFMWGLRGQTQVGSEFDMLNRVHQVAAFRRFDYQPLYATTENMCGTVYNIFGT